MEKSDTKPIKQLIMGTILKQCVSLDVSSESVDAVFSVLTQELSQERLATLSFANTSKGFKELKAWWVKQRNNQLPLFFTMEATGVYYEQLCRFIWSQPKTKVSVVLPNKTKKFAESLENSSKTDKLDAYALSLMGLSRPLRGWMPPREATRKLKRLTRERAFHTKSETSLKNLRHALSREFGPSDASLNRIEEMIRVIKVAKKAIDGEIRALIQQDEELKESAALMVTIPGVGVQTTAVVLAETDGFRYFTSARQLTSYAGLDVRLRESGKWKGRSKISKKGNSHIRAALYMPCLAIVRDKKPMYNLYQRLTEEGGKNGMVALTALSRKLLLVMYAVYKNRMPYKEGYGSIALEASGIA